MRRLFTALAVLLGQLAGVATAQTVLHDQTYAAGQSRTISDTTTITTGANVQVQAGASVVFQAGTKVTLGPGFRAAEGSYFRAFTAFVPPAPSALHLAPASGTALSANWTLPATLTGITGYRITDANGFKFWETTDPALGSATISGLVPGTVYTLYLRSLASTGESSAVSATESTGETPSFAVSPLSQSVTVGQSASFSSAVGGYPTPTLQWRKNGVNIAGATSTNFNLSSATLADAGNYSVVATNLAGSATSGTAVLTVNAPPSISTQPVSAVTLVGQSTGFVVVAIGVPDPSYQWRKDGTAIAGATAANFNIGAATLQDAGSYSVVVSNVAGSVTSSTATLVVNKAPTILTQPISATVRAGEPAGFIVYASGSPSPTYQWSKNGVPISGATQAAYTIGAASLSDAGAYSVAVSNVVNSVTSVEVALVVNKAPTISSEPSGTTILVGQSATFAVTATGAPAPSYQWRKNGAAIPGATSPTFLIPSAALTDAATYSVAVSNVAGTVISGDATLTVNKLPVITTQPMASTVLAGQSATFAVVADGVPAVSCQWKKNGNAIAGATSATLTIASAAVGDAGMYSVTVSNSAGSATSAEVALVVNQVPAIGSQPSGLTVLVGHSASLAVSATGSPAPSYQWKKNGSPIAGATSTTYAVSSAALSDAGTYTVVVSNSVGTATSDSAILAVNQAPVITTQPNGLELVATQPASFTVAATGTPAPSYQWNKNGSAIAGATQSSYSIPSVALSDAATYTVVVSNSAGSLTSAGALLKVSEKPIITVHPVGIARITGQGASFSVTATASPAPTYQWRKDGVDISGATQSTYTIAAVSSSDAGNYSVVVKNSIGSVASSLAPLTVNLGGAGTRDFFINAPASVTTGQSFLVDSSAWTNVGGGEQIGFFHAEYSTDNGNTWVGFSYDVNIGAYGTRNAYITAGSAGSVIKVRVRIAYRGGAAGDVCSDGTAIRWSQDWDTWSPPTTKTAQINVTSAANLPPSIAWVKTPLSAYVNERFTVEALGTDPDGNLMNVVVRRAGAVLAWCGGGDGFFRSSDANWTWGEAPGDLGFSATAYDTTFPTTGVDSGTIDHSVHINNRPPENPTLTLSGPTLGWNATYQHYVLSVASGENDGTGQVTATSMLHDADGNLLNHTLRYQKVTGSSPVDSAWIVLGNDVPSNPTDSEKTSTVTISSPGRWDFSTFGHDGYPSPPGAAATIWVYGEQNQATMLNQSINGNALVGDSPTIQLGSSAGTASAVVVMTNSGQKRWMNTDATPHRLVSVGANAGIWGTSVADMTESAVEAATVPGANHDARFSFTFNVPQTPGSYVFQWKMAEQGGTGGGFFDSPTTPVTVTVVDTTAPSAASGLYATNNTTGNSFTLNWAAASDNSGSVSYDIYCNGAFLGSSSGTTFNVVGLSGASSYAMKVRTRDAAGNEAPDSEVLNVNTLQQQPSVALSVTPGTIGTGSNAVVSASGGAGTGGWMIAASGGVLSGNGSTRNFTSAEAGSFTITAYRLGDGTYAPSPVVSSAITVTPVTKAVKLWALTPDIDPFSATLVFASGGEGAGNWVFKCSGGSLTGTGDVRTFAASSKDSYTITAHREFGGNTGSLTVHVRDPQTMVSSIDATIEVGQAFKPVVVGGSGSGGIQFFVTYETNWPELNGLFPRAPGTLVGFGPSVGKWVPPVGGPRTWTFFVRRVGDSTHGYSNIAGPYRLTVTGDDVNMNGIPDEIEQAAGTSNLKVLHYEYDANGQLIADPQRTYSLDAEGNIK